MMVAIVNKTIIVAVIVLCLKEFIKIMNNCLTMNLNFKLKLTIDGLIIPMFVYPIKFIFDFITSEINFIAVDHKMNFLFFWYLRHCRVK